jgi:hypothetical protein
MEQKIEIPDENFNFDNLALGNPISVYGGAYFTKLTNKGNDIYIQTPICGTKQGVVKSGKRMYLDLLFDKTDDNIIMWFENLEEMSRELIFNKRDSWFQDPIEMDDIESAFSPSVRLFKSGRYYLVRVFLDNPRLYGGSKNVTIYDDREHQLSIEDIKPESRIICILQIHGIKFTTKSFQIYSQLKQAMVIKTNMFNQCCIRPSSGGKEDVVSDISPDIEKNGSVEDSILFNIDQDVKEDVKEENKEDVKEENKDMDGDEDDLVVETQITDVLENDNLEKVEQVEQLHDKEEDTRKSLIKIEDEAEEGMNDNIKLEIEDLVINKDDNKDDGLREFDMDLDLNKMESITLRNQSEVYYDIYKEAREKAKQARRHALYCFIEAQNIKNTHGLEILEDSSDDEFEKQLEDEKYKKEIIGESKILE